MNPLRKYWVRAVLATWALACSPLPADPLKLSDLRGVRAKECHRALSQLGGHLLENFKSYHLGEVHEIGRILENSGLPPADAHLVGSSVSALLNTPPADSPALRWLGARFSKGDLKSETFFCVANKGCRVKEGLFIQASTLQGLRFADFSKPLERPKESIYGPASLPWHHSPFLIRTVFFPGADLPEYQRPLDVIPFVLHELQHVADMTDLVNWIELNHKRQIQGLSTHTLYRDAVRRDPETGQIEMDRRAWISYMEGRAYLVNRETHRFLKTLGVHPPATDQQIAVSAIMQIEEQCGLEFLRRWKVTPSNFFSRFEEITLDNAP